MPMAKRKAGKMMSEKPIMSSWAAAWYIQWGRSFTPAYSFTQSISSMVSARNTSSDWILTDLAGVIIVCTFVSRRKGFLRISSDKYTFF